MEFVRKLTALFYPERCPYCSALIEATQISCARCYDEIRRKHIPIPAGARGFRCISTFAYDGKLICLEVEADGVQTHHAEDAILSAWGRSVSLQGDAITLK